ncbi:MAG: formate C-acetyltransferase/glycerol dehydratase family glycyl radical enzyme [Bacillota bacterium]|nr:formate C-acetyltransferase/glycerol dehydratase family glycyl radical enzyme [Bacillota bacterium]
MMTDRVARLKDRFLDAKPTITTERLVLATEGYKKYAGDETPIFRAEVFAHVLENLEVRIRDDELIVGAMSKAIREAEIFPEYQSTEWFLEEMDFFETRERDKLYISDEDKKIAVKILDEYWRGKSLFDEVGDLLDDDAQYALDHDIISLGVRRAPSTETVPNYKKLLQIGLNGYIKECQDKLDSTIGDTKEKQEQILFWKACIIACKGVITLATRYADRAAEMAEAEKDEKRKAELLRISENCRNVPANQPRNFYEALQAIWFIHLAFHIEVPAHACSFGRFDQIVYPYMEKDKEANTFDKDECQEILECFFIKCNELVKIRDHWTATAFSGFPMWAILMIGGQDIHGNDATNELSYMCLTAGEDTKTAQPVLAMRVHQGTPQDLMDQATKMVQAGMATPGFFNDDVAIPIVKLKGGTDEEALDWNIVGCTQPHPGGGCSDGTPDAGYVNLAKVLELVLHNGVDPATGRQIGLKTGDPADFTCKEDIMAACKEQIEYLYQMIIKNHKIVQCAHMLKLPVIFASLTMDGCIENGKSVQEGGTKYNSNGLFATGPANVADSLVAIENLIFKEKAMTLPEFVEILDNNYEGNEILRQKVLNTYPKVGNDDEYVDNIEYEILTYCVDATQPYKDARGGNFDFTLMSQTMNVVQGAVVGATPDGRLAGEPVNDNASPMMGRDVSGPTATVNSIGRLGQTRFKDGALFNLRFDPRGIEGEKGLETIQNVIKTYFKNGGQHIQVNVVNDDTLRDAQAHPERHRGLLVRVAGYMAYFTELDEVVQDAIISRTAHLSPELGCGGCGCGGTM